MVKNFTAWCNMAGRMLPKSQPWLKKRSRLFSGVRTRLMHLALIGMQPKQSGAKELARLNRLHLPSGVFDATEFWKVPFKIVSWNARALLNMNSTLFLAKRRYLEPEMLAAAVTCLQE
eukprot:12249203-Karenia_brevis.AAC.1